MSPRSPGPLCICGCYQSEHMACGHGARWDYAECQTCSDCERFTTTPDEADARTALVAPAAGGDQ